MTTEKDLQELRKVITAIRDANSKYTVLDNLDKEENHVAGLFPSLILKDAKGNSVFIIEVRRNGEIAKCIQQWKAVSSIPATLYIVVPEGDLQTAQSVAQVVGLQTRFGSFTSDENGNVSIKYL